MGLPGLAPPVVVNAYQAAGGGPGGIEAAASAVVITPALPRRPAEASTASSKAGEYQLWVLPTFMDAFLFEGSSKGILAQAVSGAGVTFLTLANRIVKEVGVRGGAVLQGEAQRSEEAESHRPFTFCVLR